MIRRKKPKRLLFLCFAITAGLSVLFPAAYSQEELGLKEQETLRGAPKIDADKNKIFDDLEAFIGSAQEDERFDVIVILKASLDLLPDLKYRHGEFTEKFKFRAINGFAATLRKGQILSLAADPDVQHIEHDAPVFHHLDAAQQWFGTTKARTDFGVDGNADGSANYSKDDIVVAVLDTGIDPNHVDLNGGKIIGWKDIPNNQPNPYDETGPCGGHGTHVSSIAAGEGALKGVAPGAALVGIKVLSERFVQGVLRCSGETSEVMSGVQWMIDNKTIYGIEVGNMSLGSAGCSDGTDALSSIVNAAADAGIVMAVSAGNEGPGSCTIGSPAAAEKAITVGAMADVMPGSSLANSCGDNDLPNAGFYLACFSSRGPTADGRIKPDITAPGVFIQAAKAGTADQYIVYSGTSMSSPFVAGLLALLLDANPTLVPLQLKQKLDETAQDWGPAGKDVDYGSGRLQGYEAVKSAGGFSGQGPAVPFHSFTQDSLSSSNTQDLWEINVTDASLPLAITLVMPDWVRFNDPDFDMELKDPAGSVIATSRSATRQETIGVQPSSTGIYTLRVYRFRGSGQYFFDVSFGKAAVAITLITDGTTPFGVLNLGATQDTASSGTNDPQTVRVDAGPGNLDIKTTTFSDGTNVWALGATNGPERVKWEFSQDAILWTTFGSANTLYTLAANLSAGSSQNVYFRLTMPTETASPNQFSATVTIVATTP